MKEVKIIEGILSTSIAILKQNHRYKISKPLCMIDKK